MRIFVTGASGYIGSAVAGALSRAGHQVFGLVRTAEKARAAEAREIAPVLGALQDTAAWSGAAASCQVCIHCAFDSSAGWNADRMAIETVLDRAHESGQPRLSSIRAAFGFMAIREARRRMRHRIFIPCPSHCRGWSTNALL